MWTFAPTHLDAADFKSDNRSAPSDPVFDRSHTDLLPLYLPLAFVGTMIFFGIMIFSLQSNTDERKTNKVIVTKVCITNQIISAIKCVTNYSQIHSNQQPMVDPPSVLHREHTGTIEGHFQGFRMITFVKQLFWKSLLSFAPCLEWTLHICSKSYQGRSSIYDAPSHDIASNGQLLWGGKKT